MIETVDKILDLKRIFAKIFSTEFLILIVSIATNYKSSSHSDAD